MSTSNITFSHSYEFEPVNKEGRTRGEYVKCVSSELVGIMKRRRETYEFHFQVFGKGEG